MINSEEYWENRFKTGDWDNYSGEQQTQFFVQLALSKLPNWIKDDIETKELNIVDIGCAKGEGTDLLKKCFTKSEVTGIDFSKSAIQCAEQKYPACKFLDEDINQINGNYDVVFCSNVLEHFVNPFDILNTLIGSAKKYLILLLPFQEENLHTEHFVKFDYNSFDIRIGNFYNCYYKVIDSSKVKNTMWNGKQILLIYVNEEYISQNEMKISRIHNWDFEKKLINKEISEQKLIEKDNIISNQNNTINQLNQNHQDLENKFVKLKNNYQDLENKFIKLKNSYQDIEKNNINIQDTNIELINQIEGIEKEKQDIYKVYKTTFEQSAQYQQELQSIYNSNMWKMAQRYYRIRDKFKRNRVAIYENKEEIIAKSNDVKIENKILIDKSVNMDYTKQDIIILSVIDWNFRFQRPQHIAKNMSKLGHRVFYFNVNYSEDKINILEDSENLYLVTLSNYYGKRIYDIDLNKNEEIYQKQINQLMHQYNIRDCSVIIEYPTWEPLGKYLKNSFGSQIIFDYIDDYTGFEETTNQKLIETTKGLLEISDITIATSEFLAEKAKEYTDKVEIVRNGTEFEFFNSAQKKSHNKIPKIGYYGAIAEWFDLEKIEYIAKERPDIEIELIGHVSDDKCYALKKYNNVKLLGEKNYSELPNYLKNYDVCLIPFKSDIDLIKATNPVKFYEYLSAGKKVVATEIPELEPFRGKYVYLANENRKFLEYITQCIEGKDTLAPEEEKIKFAQTQDWLNRCKNMETILKEKTPLVSIILVTYNNINYTKQCIDSILNKTAYPNYEIIIVDNLSKDETRKYLLELEKQQTSIKVILNDVNSGFAGGNNIGIKACKGEYIILLNNDTLVTRGWITGMIKHLDKKNIGMVGPVTNSIGNESQINIAYNDIRDMEKFALEYTTKHHNELYEEIKVLAMFCVAIKRSVLNEIGLLDENYKVGMFEDDDYSMALREKGYEVACVEDVFIHHFGNVSFKKLENKKYMQIFEHNKCYFESKWDTTWVPHKYRKDVN